MKKYLLLPIFLILAIVLIRLLPHFPNFTPVAAVAMFAGVYLNKKWAFIVPIAGMLISDLFLPTHNTILYVYGAFILSGIIGIILSKHKTAENIILGSLMGSILFFLITNAGVWIQGAYARDLSGLWQSYVMGIPFFRWTVSGDLFYTTAFFGVYELVINLYKKPLLYLRRA